MNFEKATRNKYRFQTTSGLLSTEDLWDLPLTSARSANLDDIAKDLAQKIKGSAEVVSFVKPASNSKATEMQEMFDIVLHIINVKVSDRDQAQESMVRAQKKQKLQELIQAKKDEALSAASIEELEKMLTDM